MARAVVILFSFLLLGCDWNEDFDNSSLTPLANIRGYWECSRWIPVDTAGYWDVMQRDIDQDGVAYVSNNSVWAQYTADLYHWRYGDVIIFNGFAGQDSLAERVSVEGTDLIFNMVGRWAANRDSIYFVDRFPVEWACVRVNEFEDIFRYARED